jgi:hypothetical protein
MRFNFSHKILFPGQQENEKICMVLREHWFVFFSRFLAWVLFAAILLITDWAINQFAPALKKSPYLDYVNLIKSVYLMFLMLGLLIIWVMYYLNVQIITSERVVDIVQDSLVRRKVSELHLSRLEDVTAEVTGVFGTFLDYGNVYIQTAAETERFTFSRVPNPAGIEKLILDLYEELPENEKLNKEALKK